jgi:hypothetical protein
VVEIKQRNKGRFNVLPKLKPEEKDVKTPFEHSESLDHAVNDVVNFSQHH